MKKGSLIIYLIVMVVAIGILSPWLSVRGAAQVIAGTVFLLLVPGLVWMEVIYPADRKNIKPIERAVFSFVFSIVVMPLSIYYLHHFLGVKITTGNILLTVLGISSLGGITKLVLNRYKGIQKKGPKDDRK